MTELNFYEERDVKINNSESILKLFVIYQTTFIR